MKNHLRKFSLALAAVMAVGVFAFPVAADDAAGSQISAGQYSVAPSDGQAGGALIDANRSTSLKFSAGTQIFITSGTPFDSIYLVWDTPPAGHEIAAGGQTHAGTRHGFLHEYIKLDNAVAEATINLIQGEYTLCDIYLFSGNNLPDFVQVWQPPCERADLLALPTHADDEHLFFGGTLPYYAGELGLNVQVVYMTNHFGEPYRPHELLNGLWEVGVTAYPVMGPFPDLYASLESVESAEACFGRESVVEFQVEMIRHFQPRVIVAHDIGGEYGHGAHILNAQTLLEALPLTGDENAFPESARLYGTYEVPKTYLHLWGENQTVMDWNVPLERFGGKTAFEKAVDGFARHVSQTDYFAVQQSGTWEDCRIFGLAHTTVGPDVAGGDFFENIDMAPEPEPEPIPAASARNSPDAPPGDSVARPEKTGFPFGAFVVVLIAVVAAALVVLLLISANRRKRRRRAGRSGGKTTYHKRM